jgi:hypothetical protein
MTRLTTHVAYQHARSGWPLEGRRAVARKAFQPADLD